jgi:sugar lactone lactonase YvrE
MRKNGCNTLNRKMLKLLAVIHFLAGPTNGQQIQWSQYAGNDKGPGFTDGTGAAARFHYPRGMGADSSGNLYVADTNNHTIRKITPAGVCTTFAGTALLAGTVNGSGAAVRFNFPQCIAVGSDGTLYVTQGNMVRKITSAGTVSAFAGSSTGGSTNGTGTGARFNGPFGVAVDTSGNVYVADTANQTIRKITSNGVVSLLAGTVGTFGTADGTGTAARFSTPMGLATDSSGNVYVADNNNHTIRKITPSGVVTTIAGTPGTAETVDGDRTTARLNYPEHLVLDTSGNIYVVEYAAVRKVTPTGTVTTLAGGALGGRTNGVGTAARFLSPYGITRDASGNLFVVDSDNHSIRRIATDTTVTTFAGGFTENGSTDGSASVARFNNPIAGSSDSAGNLFIADYANHTIRKITPTGTVSTFAGTAGSSGTTNGTGAAARFNTPAGVVMGPGGILYVADYGNHTIRKITSAGVVTTFAGSGGFAGSTNGTTAARFNNPRGLAFDSAGNLYVADYNNHIIRKITSTGTVSTIAGAAGTPGSTNGNGTSARFNFPYGIAVDASGNLFVSDWGNHTIRKIATNGDVTTVAGSAGISGSANGTVGTSRLNRPTGIAFDSAGNLYVADRFNHTIRKLTSAGTMTTVGGTASENGVIADGVNTAARFQFPSAVWSNASGTTLFVADSNNERIVKGVPLIPEIVIEQPASTELTSGGSIAYGMVVMGTSVPKYFTIRNTGTETLTLSSVAVTGGNQADFPVDTSGMLTSIPAGGSTSFSVSFTPAAAGSRTTTLRVQSNDSDEANFDLSLSGTGNSLPVFTGYSASTSFGTPARLSIAKLLRKTSDADGDTVTLVSADNLSLHGGSAVIEGSSLVYTPAVSFSGEDTFDVTFVDSRGGNAHGSVTVNVAAATSTGAGSMAVNPPRLSPLPGGAMGLRFQGIPGRSYRIERSTNLASWQVIGTVTAGSTGEISHVDSSPPQPSAYYRLAIP